MKLISAHIEEHIGPIDYVFHELVSEYVHIDIHRVPPQKQRPFYTLVTSGMSEQPMTVPNGAETLRFTELMLSLPPHWRLSMEDFRDERNYWPIRLLKVLARLRFCCSVVVPPLTCPDSFRTLKIDAEQAIHFYAVLPLYQEEMECKLHEGMSVLIDRLDSGRVTELVNIRRKNTCRKSWFGG